MIQRAIKNISTKVEETKQKRRMNRQEADKYGKALVRDTKVDFESLATELSDKHSDFKNTANALAKEILQCGIDYFKSNMEGPANPRGGALELLKTSGQIANDNLILQRVDDNIQGIEDWYMNQSIKEDQNKIYDFDKIRLQTAFSFMTCDGDIDEKEVQMIREMSEDRKIFGAIDVDSELDFLVEIINQKGKGYLKDYFKMIKNAKLTVEKEIQLVEIGVTTLIADGKLDYNEMKFFRIFRTLLNATDDELLTNVPQLPDEFLEGDIFTNTYLDTLFDDYFSNVELPIFDKIGKSTPN